MAETPVVVRKEKPARLPETIAPAEEEGAIETLPATADDDELAAAEAELKGEADAKDTDAGEGTEPSKPDTGEKPPPGFVAQEALHASRQKEKTAREGVEAMQGKMDVLTATVQRLAQVVATGMAGAKEQAPPGEKPPAAPVEPTPQEKIAALQDVLVKAAKAYDQDEINLEALETKRAEVGNQIFAIQLELIGGSVGDVVKNHMPTSSGDLALSHETEKIKKAFPVVNYISEEEQDALVPIAIQRLVDAGITIDNKDPRSHLQVRRETARIANWMHGHRVPEAERVQPQPPAEGAQPDAGGQAQQAARPGDSPPPQAGQRALSPEALAVKAKLEEAQRQPPNIGATGDSSIEGGIEAIDDDWIANASEEDILALPKSVLTQIELQGVR